MLCYEGDLSDLDRQGWAAEEKDIRDGQGSLGHTVNVRSKCSNHPKESQRYAPPDILQMGRYKS